MNSKPVKISTGISVKECEFDSVNCIIKESSSVNKELFRVEETYRKKLGKFCLMNPTCVSGVELKNYLLNNSPDEFTISEFWETTIQDNGKIERCQCL